MVRTQGASGAPQGQRKDRLVEQTSCMKEKRKSRPGTDSPLLPPVLDVKAPSNVVEPSDGTISLRYPYSPGDAIRCEVQNPGRHWQSRSVGSYHDLPWLVRRWVGTLTYVPRYLCGDDLTLSGLIPDYIDKEGHDNCYLGTRTLCDYQAPNLP